MWKSGRRRKDENSRHWGLSLDIFGTGEGKGHRIGFIVESLAGIEYIENEIYTIIKDGLNEINKRENKCDE